MVVRQLSTKLPELLDAADELWIAVALATDEGLDFVRSRLKSDARQHFLIGINMGTPVSVLKALAAAETARTKARICRPDTGIFHPKLYLFRSAGQLTAILGSANLTMAGLSANQELSTLITDPQTCSQLLDWFTGQYKNAYPLTAANLSSYEEACGNADGQGDAKPKSPPVKLEKTKEPKAFDAIDFSDRYFKKEHHMAFRGLLWLDTSDAANKERAMTSDRFLELHEQIFQRFEEYNLIGLHHNIKNHIVSNHYHTHDRMSQDLNAMWLSYGKSQEEISEYHEAFGMIYDHKKKQKENDYQSFMNHARLQIRIELEEIGIWILFGKDKGSSFDREYFRSKMKNPDFRQSFFSMVKALPAEYWIEVNGISRFFTEIENADELYRLCRADHELGYFIIGRDYKITAPEMSESLLPETTLTEFRRLYPIYKSMRHYI